MPLTVSTNYGAQPKAAPTGMQDMGTKEVFLKMLVAQMENQDPLNPADSTQMSSQLAQFNMVEQQIDTNKYLKQLAGAQGDSANNLDMASAGYLGRTVMLDESTIRYNGISKDFTASLEQNTNATVVTIRDSLGTPIRNISLSAMPAGEHQIVWDGKNDAGEQMPAGDYNVDIMAFDSIGQQVGSAIQRAGVVDAVRMTSSGIQLVVNGVPTSVSSVKEVRM